TWRHDADWRAWHLPGGFVAPGETLAEACNRIANREIGTEVSLQRVRWAEGWRDHPYASVLSIVCECRPAGETRDGRFFRELPDDLLDQHRVFLAGMLKQAGKVEKMSGDSSQP